MGKVYKARDPLLDRPVALKLLHMKHLSEAGRKDYKQRFFREARIGAGLHHPNIVSIYDLGEFRNRPYIVMELLDGRPLDTYLRERGPLDRATLFHLADQIAEGLDAAHREGVTHRDIKPGNLIVTDGDSVKIVDFGLARLADSNMTETGELLGTPRYASPEQVAGKPVDHRADLFSLAVVLHEMMTGCSPFPGDSISAILFRISRGDAAIAAPPGASEAVAACARSVFMRAFSLEPERRFQSARALVAQLRDAFEAERASLASTMALPPGKVSADGLGGDDGTMIYPRGFWRLPRRDGQVSQPMSPPLSRPVPEPVSRADAEHSAPEPLLQEAMAQATVSDMALSALTETEHERAPRASPGESVYPMTTRQSLPMVRIMAISGVLVILLAAIGWSIMRGEDESERSGSYGQAWDSAFRDTDTEGTETRASTVSGLSDSTGDREREQTPRRTVDPMDDLDIALDEWRIEDAVRLADQLEAEGRDMSAVRARIEALTRDIRIAEVRKTFLDACEAEDLAGAETALEELSGLGWDISMESEQLSRLRRSLAKADDPARPDVPISLFDRVAEVLEQCLRDNRISEARAALNRLEEIDELTHADREQRSALRTRVELAELRTRLSFDGLELSRNDLVILRKEALGRKPGDLYILANHHLEGTAGLSRDRRRGIALLRMAAEEDDRAALDLARHLASGEHLSRDVAMAVVWAERSAEMKNNEAKLFLGDLYYEGELVAENHEMAFRYFEAVADTGDPEGQYRLGRCYELGHGVEKKKMLARRWYRRASKQGHAAAEEALRASRQ